MKRAGQELARIHHRAPGAGADARSGQDRARGGGGGGAGDGRPHEGVRGINGKFAEPMSDDEMNKLIERQGQVQDKIDAPTRWDLDSRLEMAMDALRCPPGDTQVTGPLGRREAARRALPAAAAEARHPAARRAHEPSRRRDRCAWLEQHLQQYEGTVIAVTHDRYFLDNVAGWILELDRGHGIPWKGNYSLLAGAEEERLQREEKTENRTPEGRWRGSWSGSACRPRARHAKCKARISAYETLLQQEQSEQARELEIYIPPGPRLGRRGDRGRGRHQGLRRPAAVRGHDLHPAAGRHRGSDRAERGGQDHAVPDDHRARRSPTQGTLKRRRDGEARLRGPEPRRPDPRTDVWEAISGRPGADRARQGAESTRAPTPPGSTSRGTDQQKKVGVLSGGERNRVHLARMLKRGATCILLDEPTNDLDVNTMRALEEALENFAGMRRGHQRTTGGFSTGSRRTSWPSRGTARSSGSTGI